MINPPPILAAIVYCIIILCLFRYTRDRRYVPSKALFLPAFMLFLMGSRSITQWLMVLSTGRPPVLSQTDLYANGEPLDRLVLSLMMVIAIAVLVQRGKLVSLILSNLPMMMFYLYTVSSVFWSEFPDIAIRRWFRAIGLLLFTFVILSDRNRDAAMRRVYAWAGFLLIPISMLWMKYYPALGRTIRAVSHNNWQMEYIGVTGQKNELGAICLVFGLTFLSYFLMAYRNREYPHRKRLLRAYGLALAILAWVFINTNSVTAQQSFLGSAFIMIAARSRAVISRRGVIHLLTLVLVAAPVAVLYLGLGSGLVNDLGRSSTFSGRTDIWTRVIALVPNRLLGAGFESFWLGSRLATMQEGMSFALQEAHNAWIETYANLGWMGIGVVLLVLITGYRNIIACYRCDPDAGAYRLAIFVSVLISANSEATFRVGAAPWFGLMLVAMASPQGARRPSTQQISRTNEMEPETCEVMHVAAPTFSNFTEATLPSLASDRAPTARGDL